MTEVQFAKQFLTTLDSKPTKYQADHVFDPKTFQTRIPYTLPKLSNPPHPLPPKSTPTTMPAPGSEPASSSAQPQTQTINLTLKSSRNPTFTLHLPSLPQTTQITTIKQHIQNLLTTSDTPTIDASKIKILHAKKPIPPSKATIHDVLAAEPEGAGAASDENEVEFGVMILGGAKDPIPQTQTLNLNSEDQAPGPGSENAAVEAATGVNPADAMKGVESTAEKVGEKRGRRESEPVQPGALSGEAVWRSKEFWVDLQGFLEQRLRDVDEAARLKGVFEKALGI